MSICAPCQVPHTAEDCEDTLTGRVGTRPGMFLSAQALQRGRTPAICEQRAGVAGTGMRPTGDPHGHRCGRGWRGDCPPAGAGSTMSSSTCSRAEVDQGNRGRRG